MVKRIRDIAIVDTRALAHAMHLHCHVDDPDRSRIFQEGHRWGPVDMVAGLQWTSTVWKLIKKNLQVITHLEFLRPTTDNFRLRATRFPPLNL